LARLRGSALPAPATAATAAVEPLKPGRSIAASQNLNSKALASPAHKVRHRRRAAAAHSFRNADLRGRLPPGEYRAGRSALLAAPRRFSWTPKAGLQSMCSSRKRRRRPTGPRGRQSSPSDNVMTPRVVAAIRIPPRPMAAGRSIGC
jgi:hypothetical protein